MLIDSYKTEGIQLFQIHTMNEFNFIPRVTLFNKSEKSKRFITKYIIDMSIRNGNQIIYHKNIGSINPSENLSFDCAKYINFENSVESIFSFYLIPEKYYGEEFISIEKEELYFYLTCQDHYVEYYNSTGFSSGVLYQSAPFNYKKFSNEATTIVQAPKVYSTPNLNTYLSLVNNSIDEDYKVVAEVKLALVDSKGEIVRRWTQMIPPYSVAFINLSLEESLKGDLETKGLYVLATNAVLLPLTFTINQKSGSLSLEHSLPPTYYSPEMRGQLRSDVVKNLKLSKLFFEI